MSEAPAPLEELTEEQLREETARLRAEVIYQRALVDKLTHENAVLKRLKFAAQSERFSAEQRELLEETFDADLQAMTEELEAVPQELGGLRGRRQPKRQALPADLPRREVRHEPDSTVCTCGCQMKRIGEDVAEKLDYVPGVFTVERHVRGKWACDKCERLVQAPVAAHIIDKGIPTAGLVAQVLVAKYADHLPLYRQETIFAGLAWRSRAPRWRSGWEAPACNCSRWWTPCATTCCGGGCCTPTRRRWRCSIPAPARPSAPTCGVTAAPASIATDWWCSTSPKAAQGGTLRSSFKDQATILGWGRSCATTTLATRGCSPPASRRGAASRMRGASSTNCGSTTRALWRSRRWSASAGCMTSSAKLPTSTPKNACASGRRRPSRLPKRCTRG